jgi:hypothetical protein
MSTTIGKLRTIFAAGLRGGKAKLNEGIAKLLKIGGRDELTEQQARQLSFHLD